MADTNLAGVPLQVGHLLPAPVRWAHHLWRHGQQALPLGACGQQVGPVGAAFCRSNSIQQVTAALNGSRPSVATLYRLPEQAVTLASDAGSSPRLRLAVSC